MVPETQEIATHPLPLDEEIARGVAIWDDVTSDHLASLVEATQESFSSLREDRSKEFGRCLAFAIDMEPLDEYAVDIALMAAATLENGGTKTLGMNTDVVAVENQLRPIWDGENPYMGWDINLRKFVGHVVMNDGSVQEGIVYTFCAKNQNAESKDE